MAYFLKTLPSLSDVLAMQRGLGGKRRLFLPLITCGILVNFFGLMLPLFSSYVYDKVLGNGITDTMWALAIAVGLVIIVEWSVRMVRIVLAERFSTASEQAIDTRIIRSMFATRVNAMPPIGRLIEKYKQLLYYRDFLSSNYILALADVPFLLVFAGAIALAAGPLVFIGLGCGMLMLLTQLFLIPVALEHETRGRRAGEKRLELMAELLAAREAVIGGTMQRTLQRQWDATSHRASRGASKARHWRGVAMSIGNSISYFSFIAVLVGGVYMVEAGLITSGGLLATSMLTSRLMNGFSSIATLVLRHHEFRRAMREMQGALPEMATTSAPIERGRLRGALSLQQVTCQMPGRPTPVLRQVSLEIAPGELVGIAGAPGSGKTTLLRLAAGLLTPDQGEVRIDQLPIAAIHPNDIAASVGYKPQDPCLLDGSIEENILMGRALLSADERALLIERSGLSHCFREQGLHWLTHVGSRGTQLSGGQRQLVALARAMLGSPSLLLFDEPTNGLDAILEQQVAKQIMALRGHATILISTHSRNLLELCDRIIVVGQGGLLADGPREKIIAA